VEPNRRYEPDTTLGMPVIGSAFMSHILT
jgi:hypothetical protein